MTTQHHDDLPGGPVSARPLHFFFIADCSGSMAGEKINTLNEAIRDAVPAMRKVAEGNPNARIEVQAIRFSQGAQWHTPRAEPVETFEWKPLSAADQTDMGAALSLCAEALKTPPMPQRALPPVLVLISDGQPTDDFNDGLRRLLAEPWGKKAVRIAIAIGEDCDLEVLRRFINNPELQPLVARDAASLVRFIRWASTAVLKAASAPASQAAGAPLAHVPLPPPPANPPPGNSNDIW